jgi:toxin ParE1/3/4
MLKLVISPAAQQDLRNIYQYGLRTWGRSQSSDYLDLIRAHFIALTSQPRVAVDRPELAQNMHSLPVKSHVVFYRLETHQLEIVRVLHGRQDPNRHLK